MAIELGNIGRAQAKVSASDGASFVHLGKGAAVQDQAQLKAMNNGKDDLVVVVGQDVYAASASRLKIDWPAGGERDMGSMEIVTSSGAKLKGAVAHWDLEATSVVERKEREAQLARRAAEARPVIIGGAVACLAGALVGIAIPAVATAAGVVACVGVAALLGGMYYSHGQM